MKAVVGFPCALSKNLASHLGYKFIPMDVRAFPDGEVNPRIVLEEIPEEVVLVNTITQSDFNVNRYLVECLFAAKNLADAGVGDVRLVMPYLPYARQDAVFRPGESYSSRYVFELFASLGVKWIFAVTTHMHRHETFLNFVSGINGYNVSGFVPLAHYLKDNFNLHNPFVLGPDGEAGKWASEVAEIVGGESYSLKKKRDRTTGAIKTFGDVTVLEGRDVIIVDDVISTGGTVVAATRKIERAHRIFVAVVHGIFMKGTDMFSGATMVTTNTVENPFSRVDVSAAIAHAIEQVRQ